MATRTYPDTFTSFSLDLSLPRWFLLVVALWELLFNRLASAMGLYAEVGSFGLKAGLALSGQLAMNAVGIMALILACIVLPRLAAAKRLASLPVRVMLMLTSPLYLPIICVAIFRPVSPLLLRLAYLVATMTVAIIAVIIAVRARGRGTGRVALVLGIVPLLSAFDLAVRRITLEVSSQYLSELALNAHYAAELLFVVAPVVALVSILPGGIPAFVRRPHGLALLFSVLALGVAIWIPFVTPKEESFAMVVAYRVLGIWFGLPGGLWVYAASLAIGVLVAASMIFPSKVWPPDISTQRAGLGIAFIMMTGIQPIHPYQFALQLTGFLFLAQGLLKETPPLDSALDRAA